MANKELPSNSEISEITISNLTESTSSLGLNLSADDLPDECLALIFKKVSSEYIYNVSEVSARWENIVQHYIPLDVWVTDIGFRMGYRFFDGLGDLTKYSIKSVKTFVLTEAFPPLKDPEELKTVEFMSQTNSQVFRTLTENAINLREVHFGYSSLASDDLSSVPLNLPGLQEINICDKSFESKEIEHGGERLESNISYILQQHFRSLKSLRLLTVATRRVTEKYATLLIKFLEQHSSTLTVLDVAIQTSIQRDAIQDYGNLEHVAVIKQEDLDSINWEKLQSIRFKELELDFGYKFFVGAPEWHKILEQQNQLSSFKLSPRKPLPQAISFPAVINSGENLVTIHLGVQVFNIRTNQTIPIDCSVFEFCLNLKMLTLVSDSLSDETRDLTKEIINVDKLPKSLEAFGAENILMSSSDISHVFFSLPEIKKVALERIGLEGEFGMTLPLIQEIIRMTKLAEIIVRGFNGDECELYKYDNLMQLGLNLPLKKTFFHVTFFKHFQEYMLATTPDHE